MAVKLEVLEFVLRSAFPGAEVVVQDLAGDDEHYGISVVSKSFQGKSRIKQHQEVYSALSGIEVHAVQIKTSCEG